MKHALLALPATSDDNTTAPNSRFPVEVLNCSPWPSEGFMSAWRAVILTDGNGLGEGLDVHIDGPRNGPTQAPPGPREREWLALMRSRGLI